MTAPLITFEDTPMGITIARLGIHKCGEIGVSDNPDVAKISFWCSFRTEGDNFRYASDRDAAKRKIEKIMLEWLRGADPDWCNFRNSAP